MAIIIIRAIIVFLILLAVIRMMGKRQIGEMEPFEIAITLVIAELACIPMADKTVPLTYGIVSIMTMYVIHQVIILLTKRNKKIQGIVSGSPVLVIDKNGVKYDALKSLNMQMGDLLQAMRSTGYFSIEQIAYALFETNGQLSVIPYPTKNNIATLPIPVVIDGQWSQEAIDLYQIDKEKIQAVFTSYNITAKNILIATLDEQGKLLIHPQDKKYFITQLHEVKND